VIHLKTIQNILDWVDNRIPNPLATSNKIIYLSDLIADGEFREFNSRLEYWDTCTVSTGYTYSLPAGVTIKDIRWVGISPTTYNTSNVISTTTPFTEYKYIGLRDPSRPGYFDDKQYSSNNVSLMGITPRTTNSYHLRVIYKPYQGPFTASTDSTTIVNCDDQLYKYLQYKMAAEVCRSLAFPRIDLANNYELEAMQAIGTARTNYYNTRRRTSKRNISYKDWW